MAHKSISPFANARDKTTTMKLKRKILYARQKGMCYYCGIWTVYPKRNHHYNPMPDNLATVEHIYGRYDIRRAVCKRTVLSCYKCNCEKAHLEMKQIKDLNYHLPHEIDLKQFLITSN